MDKLRVFISSTMEDLSKERQIVAEAINKNRFWEAIFAESFVARSESPREVCLEEVKGSHVYIGIFKKKYGYIPSVNNPKRLSAVALEYEEAICTGLPVFIFVCRDARNREQRLVEFLSVIEDFSKGHWRKEYTDATELGQLVLDAVNYEITRNYVELIDIRINKRVQDIYKLPYFVKLSKKTDS